MNKIILMALILVSPVIQCMPPGGMTWKCEYKYTEVVSKEETTAKKDAKKKTDKKRTRAKNKRDR